jgi:hypothetical protein
LKIAAVMRVKISVAKLPDHFGDALAFAHELKIKCKAKII